MACALAFGSDDFKTELIMTEVSNNANVTVIKCINLDGLVACLGSEVTRVPAPDSVLLLSEGQR